MDTTTTTTVNVYLLQPPVGLVESWEINRALADHDHPLHDEATFWFDRSFRGPYDPRLNYELAATYQTDKTGPFAACEDAFHEFNVGDSDVARHYRQAGHRSLSVGDIVVVDGEAWICASAGWDLVDDFTPTTKAV